MSTLSLRKNLLPGWTNDIFDTGTLFGRNLFDFNGDFPGWNLATRVPTVNIREMEKNFMLEMAVPGMEKKDFRINVENNMLTISCEKKEESTDKKPEYTRREFSFNSFSRSFNLPENSLPDKIDAKYEKGLLMLVLPKKEVSVAKALKEIKVL